jgi:hypothetical protein
MVKRSVPFLFAAFVVLGFLLVSRYRELRMYRAYNRITVGTDLASIQQMLGPGSRIREVEVPRSMTGPFVDGVRTSQPVVKGDAYYEWTDENGRRIVIAFVGNCVKEKWYWEPDL